MFDCPNRILHIFLYGVFSGKFVSTDSLGMFALYSLLDFVDQIQRVIAVVLLWLILVSKSLPQLLHSPKCFAGRHVVNGLRNARQIMDRFI